MKKKSDLILGPDTWPGSENWSGSSPPLPQIREFSVSASSCHFFGFFFFCISSAPSIGCMFCGLLSSKFSLLDLWHSVLSNTRDSMGPAVLWFFAAGLAAQVNLLSVSHTLGESLPWQATPPLHKSM